MFLAKHSNSLIRKPHSSLCLISSALVLLLSACSSTVDKSSANASEAKSSQEDNRIVYMIPDYKGKSWAAQDEDEYLNALQKTDLVFDEDKVQLINIQGAAPSRIVLYKQVEASSDAQNQAIEQNNAQGDDISSNENSTDTQANPAKETNEAPQTNGADAQSDAKEATNVASTEQAASEALSLVEVATLASSNENTTTLEAPADKVVRTSSIRDTKNHWQKSQKPCYNCTNPTEYDPFYYEPFYKKFPTPGVDKK